MERRILVMAFVLILCALLIPASAALAETQGKGVYEAGREALFGQVLAKGVRIKCFASVKYPLPGRGGAQTVYIHVADAAGRGVAGASVRLLVHQHNGDRWLWAPATNAAGDSVCVFPLNDSPAGYPVLIEVIARWQGQQVKAYTSYTPCW